MFARDGFHLNNTGKARLGRVLDEKVLTLLRSEIQRQGVETRSVAGGGNTQTKWSEEVGESGHRSSRGVRYGVRSLAGQVMA